MLNPVHMERPTAEQEANMFNTCPFIQPSFFNSVITGPPMPGTGGNQPQCDAYGARAPVLWCVIHLLLMCLSHRMWCAHTRGALAQVHD